MVDGDDSDVHNVDDDDRYVHNGCAMRNMRTNQIQRHFRDDNDNYSNSIRIHLRTTSFCLCY